MKELRYWIKVKTFWQTNIQKSSASNENELNVSTCGKVKTYIDNNWYCITYFLTLSHMLKWCKKVNETKGHIRTFKEILFHFKKTDYALIKKKDMPINVNLMHRVFYSASDPFCLFCSDTIKNMCEMSLTYPTSSSQDSSKSNIIASLIKQYCELD